jgi:hypothetical protein
MTPVNRDREPLPGAPGGALCQDCGLPNPSANPYCFCRPAEPTSADVDWEQRRADAANLLLDMLYMRNGAHEGMSRDVVEKLWKAVHADDGFPSVVQFLSAVAAAQEGKP